MRTRSFGLALLLVVSLVGWVRADRLFGTSNSVGLGLIEMDPHTGQVLNVLSCPPRAVWDGLAFDGANLWFLGLDMNTLFKLDPDTGATLDSIVLPQSDFRTGLAYLNGLLYTLDWSVLTQDITIIDPVQRAVVGTLDINGANPGAPLLGNRGLEAISGPDALLLGTAFGKEILEVDPTTGVITNQFTHVQNDDVLGIATIGGEIYLANNVGDEIFVYSRSGTPLRDFQVPFAPRPNGFQSLAGDDTANVPEPSTACLAICGAVATMGIVWRRRRRSVLDKSW